MKTKQKKFKTKVVRQDQRLTLMAVQEKLGLFAKPAEKTQAEQARETVPPKPLGLI